MSAGIEQILADLRKAKERVAAIRDGTMGVRGDSGNWNKSISSKVAMPNGELARANQLRAREADVARLELQYVQAMLGERKWTAAAIIEAMTLRPAMQQSGAAGKDARRVINAHELAASRNPAKAEQHLLAAKLLRQENGISEPVSFGRDPINHRQTGHNRADYQLISGHKKSKEANDDG